MTTTTVAEESAVTRISMELGIPITIHQAKRLPCWVSYLAFAVQFYG